MARCECAGCGERFGGVGGFDTHQVLDPGKGVICRPPGDVGLRLVDGIWCKPGPRVPLHAARDEHSDVLRPSPV